MSKTAAVSLPAALALVLWMRRAGPVRRHAVALAPFLVLALGLGALSAWAEARWVGATGEQWDETPAQRVLVAGRALWFYAGKLAWPHPVSFNYPRWDVAAAPLGWWLWPASAAALPVLLWSLRHRLGRGPLVAVLFFGGALLPFLGFVDFYFLRYSFVSDHLQYLASAGLLALAGAAIARGLERLRGPGLRLASVGLMVVLALLATLVARRVPVYADDETLWRATIAENPDAWVAHMLLGFELAERGAYDEAIASYDRAEALTEGFPRARVAAMRGEARLAAGDFAGAIADLKDAVEVKPTNFDHRWALARALEQAGRPRQADRQYRHALVIDPQHVPAMERLARLKLDLGEASEALRVLEVAEGLEPRNAEVQRLLGRAHATLGGRRARERALRARARAGARRAGGGRRTRSSRRPGA